jgi:hypothetical protein
MKAPQILTLGIIAASFPHNLSASTLLFSDNFNVPNTDNFDGSPLVTGNPPVNRRGGTLANVVALRSARAQQWIREEQVSMRAGPSRLRFQEGGNWFNWAAGATGEAILADGGIRVEFDWVPTNTTSTNWVSFNIGLPGAAAGEPGVRVNHQGTDFGILFRNTGGTQLFDNGAVIGDGGNFPATTTSRHVVLDYAFSTFNDGALVRLRASVDGVRVATNTFSWDMNAVNGLPQLIMELETNEANSLIDNYRISTIPSEIELAIDRTSFMSGLSTGGLVGTLSSTSFSKGPVAATYALVPSPEGDPENQNSLFRITGDRLEVGTYNFKQDFEGSQYTVRVRATATESGSVFERDITLFLIKDDDADGILDSFELEYAGNLTDLNGLLDGPGPGPGTGDFDGDGISDLEEFRLSQSTFPGINPIVADTDGDGLPDGAEILGAGLRPPTSPTRADTDGDGLNDGAESNTGIYVNAQDTGTSPVRVDSDGDGARDGFEVARGSNPLDIDSRPPLPASVRMVRVTDEASVGISPDKNYTHLISGGGAATVNGVLFQDLNNVEGPENFLWDIFGGGARGVINTINNRDWQPALGDVSGQGLLDLLGGFVYQTWGEPGGFQTYTLTGLTPGRTYELRIYTRLWDVGASGRPIDLIFTNGSTVEQPFGGVLMDRPSIALNVADTHAAYYISYTYVAEATELIVNANVHPTGVAASGSHHLYALSNEALAAVTTDLRVTGVTRDPAGNLVIDFVGGPNRTYQVKKSPDLATTFGPLTLPLTATTNAGGVGQAIVPASEASEPREFYRIEE